MTRQLRIGDLYMGGGSPITVQTMTNTDTADAESTLDQIRRMAEAGADIVRVTVNTQKAADAVRDLVDGSPVPLVADIHFDYRLAIAAIENGIHKVRINPGNIGGEEKVRMVADCLKAHHIPVRIGVNSGSLEKELLAKYGHPCAEAMVESAVRHAAMLEKYGFYDIAVSLKCTNVRQTIEAARLMHEKYDYPQHIGITESGTPEAGMIKSAVGIGTLLMEGIGDTIRVSFTGDPVREVEAGLSILRAAGLRNDRVEVISCPTCGRTVIDVEGIARRVAAETKDIRKPLKIAVMGCVVNGPGEAREADVGICGGKDAGMLIVRGREPVVVKGDLFEALMKEVRRLAGE